MTASNPHPDPSADLHPPAPFPARHIGPGPADQATMVAACGYQTLEDLLAAAVPESIRDHTGLDLPEPVTEERMTELLREVASRNTVHTSMIGMGYHDTHTPAVIRRNVLENPAWYTAYTPYQPEISQGRLEALLNFQTMIADLTGLPVAGASLLDEATAAAEAMTLARRVSRAPRDARFLVDADCLPQTVEVIRTRARPLGIDVALVDMDNIDGTDDGGLPPGDVFGVLLAYPGACGAIRDHTRTIAAAHERGALVAVSTDLLALTLLRPPGQIGADIAVGSSQRFGVPLGFGGPHAGYLSVRDGLARSLPGRLVGVSVDADGNTAYRLALQTREQHIRREKATSNICTAQVLLAVIAGMYAVYHGPHGLRRIAHRVHRHAVSLAAALRTAGIPVVHDHFFDTVLARVPGRAEAVTAAALARGINLWQVDADTVSVSCDETTSADHVTAVAQAFGAAEPRHTADTPADALPDPLRRGSDYLTHPVFHRHRSETAMMRYLRRLADRDLALDRSMIPLGSCTMKLNAAAEMEPVTWPEFGRIHPFAPPDQTEGYRQLIDDLQRWLVEITGYDAVSLQPNAGSQGELAGLLAIRAYHRAAGEEHRDVCLIPSSAHGTNAASAVMAGMRVVVVSCRDSGEQAGDIDLDDLRAKVATHADTLAALMITYPSTHGVFETDIAQICAVVHDAGGQVYVDGANLNALVGLARPGRFGADVSHLNLHKTFCIPHGGGGPGVGPVGVRAHLAPYLPNHPLAPTAGPATGVGPVAGAPWGSASILPITWAYVRMMGADGLRRATGAAVLAANYVARALAPHFPVLYSGRHGLVAHECVLDLRPITKRTGITVDDVAKRLIDYGFHAPTMSFPVAGTLMVEPTESENLEELNRFIAAMVGIRGEIERVATGSYDRTDNPLRNAPHTAAMLATEWKHPYPAAEAVFPDPSLREDKYWPPVRRIDGGHGDRNLVCACPPVSDYEPLPD